MVRNESKSRTSATSTSALMTPLLVVALLGAGCSLAPMPSCHAFQPLAREAALVPMHSVANKSMPKVALPSGSPTSTQLFALGRSKRGEQDEEPNANDADADADANQSIISSQRRSTRQRFRKKAKMAALGAFTALSLHLGGAGGGALPALRPPAAIARLPMDAVQDTNLDMKQIGMDRAEKERAARRTAEALAHRAEGDRIEEAQGSKVRKQFEAEYEKSLERSRTEKAAKREELLDSLLDQGICPFTDTEGLRQVFLLDEDIDLAQVEGTEAYYDHVETMAGKGSRVQKKYVLPRFIVKAQVDDLRAHGKEVVPYFQENQARTAKLFDMPERKLQAICEQYQTRIAQYGTLNPVTEGDKQAMVAIAAASPRGKQSAGIKSNARGAPKTSTMSVARQQKREAKEASRAAAAEARAAARVAKEEARAAKRAERDLLREEKLTSMQERKDSNAATKAATKAAAAVASHAAADSEIAATAGMDMAATAGQEAVSPSHMDEADVAPATADSTAVQKIQAKKDLPIVPVVTMVGVAGGGGYAFKVMKERKEAEEEYRQQQMQLIMGLDADDDDDDDEDVGGDDEPDDFVGSIGSDFPSLMDPKKDDKPKPSSSAGASSPPSSSQVPPPAAPKRRFGGIKSVFSKKPGRESDINNLIGAEGKAPDFSSVVAKSLTFGAPGRFPHLESLPAASSMEEFDLETARGFLREEADKAALSDQDACEEFAKVVNCMIIDIIDLASATLKEKDEKPTIAAMNIVMDFMDHSAGLFEPFLSEGISIKPVTYCGSLGKGKLEQLYATYGAAGMTNTEATEDRVDMFRELFEIKEKKAEGLLQKKMMSSLFKMMKDPEAMQEMMGGEGMEGMEEMMKAMGGMEGMEGMEGLAGMPGMDEELSPEQLKESVNMMKELVESGNVSKEEMKNVKEMFKGVYGMDLEELIENADSDDVKQQLGDDGEELIEMFKVILDATKD